MPFYEYECASCKFYTELLQKVSDPPLRKCPSCGRSTMKKLVSAPNFRLKGGGWYETDFKSDQEKKRNLAVDKEPQSKGADDASKAKATESKPADSKPADSKSAEKAAGTGSSTSSASSRRRKAPAKSKPRAKAVAKRRARR